MAVRMGTFLQAGLENLFEGLLRGARDVLGVGDGVGQGRFAIDVFAGIEGREDDVAVEMGWRGDDDRLHFGFGEEFLVVVELFGFGGVGGGAVEPSGEGVADGDDLGVFVLAVVLEEVEGVTILRPQTPAPMTPKLTAGRAGSRSAALPPRPAGWCRHRRPRQAVNSTPPIMAMTVATEVFLRNSRRSTAD
jgi:hypothetical protein